MNKLLLDNHSNLSNIILETDTEVVLELKNINQKINITIIENVNINMIEFCSNTKNKINIKIGNNANVTYNKIGKDINDDVFVLLEENSTIRINSSIINNKESNLLQRIEHSKCNSSSYIVNHGINNSINNLKFKVDVVVNKNSNNSISEQENKIINIKNGMSYIYPNLIVDNKEVNLSHSAYIGNFDKDVIFYLKSRGIKEENCMDLLFNGFLINKLCINDDYKNKVIDFITEWR